MYLGGIYTVEVYMLLYIWPLRRFSLNHHNFTFSVPVHIKVHNSQAETVIIFSGQLLSPAYNIEWCINTVHLIPNKARLKATCICDFAMLNNDSNVMTKPIAKKLRKLPFKFTF